MNLDDKIDLLADLFELEVTDFTPETLLEFRRVGFFSCHFLCCYDG